MKALITGATGQLGSDLRTALENRGNEVMALARADLDITDDVEVARVLGVFGPAAVFNCAAFHNVEECEREEAQAAAVNVRAVKHLAVACAGVRATLVHFSTNYVFDGTAATPYAETDLPSPRSIYAITKHAGEHAAMAYAPGTLVIRTAGLYGLAGSASKGGNFVERMITRASAGEPIRMVADQLLSPTYTADLAAAVVEARLAGAAGVLHLTNAGACSWYEFTQAIVANAGLATAVEAVDTVTPPGAAQRPLNGVLACAAADAFGLAPLRPWDEALADYMGQAGLLAPGGQSS